MIKALEAIELSHIAGGVTEAPNGTGCGQTTPTYHVNPDGTRGAPIISIIPVITLGSVVPATTVAAL